MSESPSHSLPMPKNKHPEDWERDSTHLPMKKEKTFRYWQEPPSTEKYQDCANVKNLNSKKKRKLKRMFHQSSCSSATSSKDSRSYELISEPGSKLNEINETEVYYEKVLQSLKMGLHKEARDLFVNNVLQESENKEVELSCHASSSHCLELLLTDCKDPAVIYRFMSAFSQNKTEVCSNSKASHITELLIMHALQNIKNLTSHSDVEENISWIEEFSDFILENFNLCLSNIYSCHVMCTLIKALGGEINEDNKCSSKKSRLHKEEFRRMFTGDDENQVEKVSVILEEIPKSFIKILKKLSRSLVKLENIADYATDSSAAAVIETLLLVLKKRLPKKCDKFVIKLAKNLYEEKSNEGIPLAFLHKNCSFIVENMFKAASEKIQFELWLLYFATCLTQLVNHHIGNYVLQRLFDVVQDKLLFEEMCTAMWNSFDDVLKTKHYGIFVSMSSACNRLKAQQAQFTMNMMQCLNCSDSEEKQLCFMQLLLGFEKFENYTTPDTCKSSEISISLQGSLVAQAMFEFQKPLKLVASLLNMKPDQLSFLAGHIQGCHVLNSFFRSISVGEKNKEKMINILMSIIVPLACDRSRSLTLSRIWVLLSVKLKEIIVKELINNEEKLMADQNGSVFYKKCGTYYFKKKREEWYNIQSNLTNSRKNRKR